MKHSAAGTASAVNSNVPFRREACAHSFERALSCGAIVREQHGRIIAKVSFLSAPKA